MAFEIEEKAAKKPAAPNEWNDLRDALGAFDPKYDGPHLDTRPAGYALRKYQGRVIEDKRFLKGQETRLGYPWYLEKV